eukprot:1466401-Prymnesium_polylepis.1
MAGQGREDVLEVSAAAEQAAPNAPRGERSPGSVPSPQVSMTSTAHRRTYPARVPCSRPPPRRPVTHTHNTSTPLYTHISL